MRRLQQAIGVDERTVSLSLTLTFEPAEKPREQGRMRG
jgi:hypothetical protein